MSNPFISCGLAVVGAMIVMSGPGAMAATTQHGLADLATRVARHEVQMIEVAEPAIAAQTTSVAMRLGDENVTLNLSRHSVRSANFRFLVQTEAGIEERPAPPEKTWRGWVAGRPGSRASASIVDGRMHAHVTLDGTTYWIQPMRDFDAKAEARAHAVYKHSDVLPGNETCGLDLAPGAAVAGFSGGAEGACSYVAEISFDADVEYYQLLGGLDPADVVTDIGNLMLAVNNIYERDVHITHAIGTILVRTVEFDPYFSSDAGTLLDEFRTEWNTNQIGVVRDVAHLMTGKDLDGSVIGVAWLGVVCDLDTAYGLSQSQFTTFYPHRVILTAHELGHNWGAGHCGSGGCSSQFPPQPCESTCSIMCTCVSGCAQGLDEFESCSAGAIIAYRNSPDAACIDPIAPGGSDPPVIQEFYGNEGDRKGTTIAMSGTLAIVGAYLDDELGVNAGAAYIYRFDPKAMMWKLETKLLAPDGAAGDTMGLGVDIVQEIVDGNPVEVAIAGAPGQDIPEVTGSPINNAGAAYVFRNFGGSWSNEAKLYASDWKAGNAGDNFGRVVSMARSGGTEIAIAGAMLDNVGFSDTGSAYIYRNGGAGWLEEKKLVAAKPMFNDFFGYQVSIGVSPLTGLDTALVSAYTDELKKMPIDAGSVYVFQMNGVEWQQMQNLTASDAAQSDNFGAALAFGSGGASLLAVIGAPNADDQTIINSGAAYIFRETLKGWVEEIKLVSGNPRITDRFGFSVAVDNDIAMIGTPFDNRAVADTGSAYLYRYFGGAWTLQNHFTPIDPVQGDQFGYAVAVSNERVMMSAPGEDANDNINSGTVYAYTPVPLVDCNDNGYQDECEIAADPALDLNLNGILDECEPCFPTVDCNGNGVLDSCDIAKGTSMDVNLNGIPDECDPSPCPGDINLDGLVDVVDLLAVINGWGACPGPPTPCSADVAPQPGGDGTVDVLDLLAVINGWGQCP